MCVFLLFLCSVQYGKRTNKKQEKLLACPCQKFNQGCLLFFGRKRKNTFFESFLDPQISFARIL